LIEKDDTRAFANSLISEIIKIQCEVAATPYYGHLGVNPNIES